MKNILIMGATGMIGGQCLKYCLENPDVAKVTIIVRKTTGLHHPKLTEIIHHDFYDFTNIADYLKNQDICLYCIGVYTGQVNKEEFSKITVDMTKTFALSLKMQSPQVAFCFLSGSGADEKEKSPILFAREKGKAENILKKLNFVRLHIFRPGYIYPVMPRKEPNFSYKLMRLLYKPLISKLGNKFSVTSEQLAEAMVKVGLFGTDKTILENQDICILP